MKTALFIDGSNIYAAARQLNFMVDYKKLLAYFNQDKSVMRAFYYTALLPPDAEGQDQLRPLLDWLEYNGYAVVTKMAKVWEDKVTGLTKIKGNMDGELAVDAMKMAKHITHAVIFSGDGDFTYLVRAIQEQGVHVTIVSTLLAQMAGKTPMIADELRRACDLFIDMKDIKDRIRKDA